MALGPGTYFTSKPPQCADMTLLANNYDGATHDSAKVESYVKIATAGIPSDVVRSMPGGRDVHCVDEGYTIDVSTAVTGHRKRHGSKRERPRTREHKL